MPDKILIVEDDRIMQDFLREALTRLQLSVDYASTGDEAAERIRSQNYDVILSDVRIPTMDGIEVLKMAKSHLPDSKVVMMTAYGTVQNAVEAMKLGAFDYVMKPISADELEIVVKKALEYKRLLFENKQLKSELAGKYKYENIVGKSPAMRKVFEQIDVVADNKSTVLITGETGTGKELVAKAIHYNSSRRDFSYVSINCASIPEGLIESELFGHEKGAFTSAIKTTLGRFEIAHGGTLVLDEISEISPALQAKLLRVLQEREFERLGSGSSIQVDVRVIAISNRDLKEEIRKGDFREDLYYRLNVLPVHLPSLRDRKEDIPLLVEFFLDRYNRETKKKIERVDEKGMGLLLNYHWPGNVRELENYIERAVVISTKSVLTESDFPRELTLPPVENTGDGPGADQSISANEKKLIIQALRDFNGNRTKAAGKLGITTRTLRNKLKLYGMK
ncbi:MAG: sigma-54 dependent transcriptional regulator [candidate division Zixibacteria bacterium]|nr:sigma-54 dependent transcriptional regulator [candidate division Zixibacteria bacterium]